MNRFNKFSAGYGLLQGPFANGGGSYDFGNWSVGAGAGGGKNHWGWNANVTRNGVGVGYGRTYYGNAIGTDLEPNKQISGNWSILWRGGSFTLQNDVGGKLFGIPIGGDGGDRWRTNAWELTIGDWSIGSTIYTNDPYNQYGRNDYNENGLNLSGKPNRIDRKGFQWGAWNRGYVYSSPLWLGLRSGNAISRVGYSHSRVQDATQNFVHRYIGRQHYYNNYRLFKDDWYVHSGYYNPFSLYAIP